MRIIRPVIATAVTDIVIIISLRQLGTFPVWYLMIETWRYGFWVLAGMFFLLTWALTVLWLWAFNKERKWHDAIR